jgi:hypothetical protein
MITDEWFMKDINAAVKKIAAVSTSPVYYYEFSFDGPFGIIKRLLGAEKLPGKFPSMAQHLTILKNKQYIRISSWNNMSNTNQLKTTPYS